MEEDPYRSYSVAELAKQPSAYRDGLFDGKVVLISGAAGGIGTACAVLFARLGAQIIGCGRTESSLADLQETMAAEGLNCWVHPANIRDPDSVADLMARIWNRYDRLDVVVNNAGGQFAAPAIDISPKGWNAVVETNLTGNWYMMQAAAREWISRGQPGCVVNMATLTGNAFVGIAHTAAARAGEINLSKTLSVEWAPHNIRINCIAVGTIASPGLKHYPPEARGSFGHNPMRKLGDVQDIAQAAVYLAGPTGQFITGSVLTVDGGEDVWGEYWALGKTDYFRTERD